MDSMKVFRRYTTARNEEFIVPNINLRLWVNAAIYFTACMISDVKLSKSLTITLLVFLATKFHFGHRVFMRGGVLLMFFIILTLAEIIPPPAKIAYEAGRVFDAIHTKLLSG
jgi:hypothetical protein